MNRLQWIRNLRDRFHSEREVETDIILTIAVHLGFESQHRAIGYTIPGTRRQADVVLFTGDDHIPGAALVVFEAKKPENPEDPLPQARMYAEKLGAPMYATCNGEYLAVYRTSDHQLQYEAASLDQLEERWFNLERLLHRAVLLQRYPSRRLPDETDMRASEHERTYRAGLQERWEQIQILYRHEGIDLRRVYVPTQLASVREQHFVEDDKKDKRSKRFAEERRLTEPRQADQVVRDHHHIVAVGDLGAGKTTMLRYLTLELAAGNLPSLETIIPVYIPLNDLFRDRRQHDSLSIEEYFCEYFRRDVERMDIPRGDVWLRWWLERGRVALLWDGLDEVTGFATSQDGNPQAAEEAIGLIRSLAERYRENRMVLTARRGAWQHRPGNLPPDFLVFEAQPFRPEDIQAFVRAWFSKEPEQADVLLDAIDSNPQANQLASNPLLLTFMVIRFEEIGQLPGRDRYVIFSDGVDLLLQNWDRDPSRRVNRRPILNGLLMRQLLGELALAMHATGARSMPKRDVVRLVTGFLDNVPKIEPGQTTEVLEHDLETKYGLFRPYHAGEYGFIHLSLQEFFAAEAISRHWDEWWTSGKLLAHVGDPWWDEVFVHLAGGDRGEVVIDALMDGQDDIFHTRLLLAGRCLAGASAPVDRGLQERVIDGLFERLEMPFEAGGRIAAILADLGTQAIIERLRDTTQHAGRRGAYRACDALYRLRHESTAAIALDLWDEFQVLSLSIMEGIMRFAGPKEVTRLVDLISEAPRLGMHLMSRVNSPRARSELLRLMNASDVTNQVRCAAALALYSTTVEAGQLIEECLSDLQTMGALHGIWLPDRMIVDLLSKTDITQIEVSVLEWMCLRTRHLGLRSTDHRIQRVVSAAKTLMNGRYSRRQVEAVKLLATLDDAEARGTARHWLTQPRRAVSALEIIVEHWPDDLLGVTVHEDSLKAFISSGFIQSRGLTNRARKVLESWWNTGTLKDDDVAQYYLLIELVSIGLTEAVPEFCTFLRNFEGAFWYPTAESLETLLNQPMGRQLVLDLLSGQLVWQEFDTEQLVPFLPDTDHELQFAGLRWCLSQVGKKDDERLLPALHRTSRALDLFIYRDESGELQYCSR